MGWLNFFDTNTIQNHHPFGRGINASISYEEEELFNKSQEAFENNDVLNAYEYFFQSLQNFCGDDSNQNVITTLQDDKLIFELFQGTARVTGYVTKESFYAESIITKASTAHVALKRHILERNYQLTYAYYFVKDDIIKLKLFHDNITMTPQKIFFPIREISLNADFDKEYMKSEFDNVVLEDISHLEPLKINELETKYRYLQQWINEAIEQITKLPSNDNAGMQAFILLYTIFKIDYLIVPKYTIYQKLSKKIQEYFNDDSSSIELKNYELKEYLQELKKINFEEFSSNFYNAKYTFNPTERTTKEDFDNFISDSLMKIRWYKNNRYNKIIPTIYKYISFYIMYNYGLHPVLRSLLHILVEIQNSNFFKDLEYIELYNEDKESFAKKAIISQIKEIIEPYKNRFKLLEPFGDELNFNSLNEFSNSFYLQLQNLNFEEI